MQNAIYTATLVRSSPRYEIWRAILESDEVPLKRPTPVNNALGEPIAETVEVYELDLARMSEAQFERLVRSFAERFGKDVAAVREFIRKDGYPIRASDVCVAIKLDMANNIIFTDGFDHYTTVTDKWDSVSSA